jgi:ParB family transcriptional regulator, chromosome partitioning protein
MTKKSGLGRGLDDLMFGIENDENANIKYIDINIIINNEKQPRKYFDEEKLNELAQSIKEKGIIQPIVVNKEKNKYEIIIGERRWRAAKKAGLKSIPCIVKNFTNREKLEIALIENIQRENLNSIEEAIVYEELIKDFKLTQDELAKRIGKSRTTISNTMRLLRLPKNIQEEVIKENITEGHARALLGIEDEDSETILKKIKKNKLSVRDVEKLVSSYKKETSSDEEDTKEKNDSKNKDENIDKINERKKITQDEKNEKEEYLPPYKDKTTDNDKYENNKPPIENKKSSDKISLRGGNLVEEALNEYENIEDEKKSDLDEESNKNIEKNEDLLRIEAELNLIFRTKVSINQKSKDWGKIEIYYKNKDELYRILGYLGYGF